MNIAERFREHQHKKFIVIAAIIFVLVGLVTLQLRFFGNNNNTQNPGSEVFTPEPVPESVDQFLLPISKDIQDAIVVKQIKILDTIRTVPDIGEQIYTLQGILSPDILASQESALPLGESIGNAAPRAFNVLNEYLVEIFVTSDIKGWKFVWNYDKSWQVKTVTSVKLPLPQSFEVGSASLPIPVNEQTLMEGVIQSIRVTNIVALEGVSNSVKNALLAPLVEAKLFDDLIASQVPHMTVPEVAEFSRVEYISSTVLRIDTLATGKTYNVYLHNHKGKWVVAGMVEENCVDNCALIADVHDPHSDHAHGGN